jgi:hypothetical protein
MPFAAFPTLVVFALLRCLRGGIPVLVANTEILLVHGIFSEYGYQFPYVLWMEDVILLALGFLRHLVGPGAYRIARAIGGPLVSRNDTPAT